MIGYLGPEGTFTQRALLSYLGEVKQAKSFVSIDLLFKALQSNEIQSMFIPIENSYGGDVFAAFEGLTHLSKEYSITGETFLEIQQSLLAKKGTSLSDVTTVFAHEQSVRQCSVFLQERLAGIESVFCSSNVVAVERVLEAEHFHVACLGHASLAETNELVVLAENVHTQCESSKNVTRFIEISKAKTESTGKDKSSFVFSTSKDQPGSLCDILKCLAESEVNMTRVSSRPAKTSLGEYLFFIDCEGHFLDSNLKRCLQNIESKCSFYMFLGSYPKGLDCA